MKLIPNLNVNENENYIVVYNFLIDKSGGAWKGINT